MRGPASSICSPSRSGGKGAGVSAGSAFPGATPGDWGLGLSLAWPLDIWRELRNLRDAAIHRYYAALERRNDFINRLMAEIAQEYFRLMALDQRLALLDRIIQFQQESLKVAQANG